MAWNWLQQGGWVAPAGPPPAPTSFGFHVFQSEGVRPSDLGLYSPNGPHAQHVPALGQPTVTYATFRNDTATDVKLFWCNFDGLEKPYVVLAPGGSYRQHTFVHHPWAGRIEGIEPPPTAAGAPQTWSHPRCWGERLLLNGHLAFFPTADRHQQVIVTRAPQLPWAPAVHARFPRRFRATARTLLLCLHRLAAAHPPAPALAALAGCETDVPGTSASHEAAGAAAIAAAAAAAAAELPRALPANIAAAPAQSDCYLVRLIRSMADPVRKKLFRQLAGCLRSRARSAVARSGAMAGRHAGAGTAGTAYGIYRQHLRRSPPPVRRFVHAPAESLPFVPWSIAAKIVAAAAPNLRDLPSAPYIPPGSERCVIADAEAQEQAAAEAAEAAEAAAAAAAAAAVAPGAEAAAAVPAAQQPLPMDMIDGEEEEEEVEEGEEDVPEEEEEEVEPEDDYELMILQQQEEEEDHNQDFDAADDFDGEEHENGVNNPDEEVAAMYWPVE